MEELNKIVPIMEEQKRSIWHNRIKPLINDEIIAEHKADPLGEHSPQLDMVLAFVRSDPLLDKPRLVVVTKTPEKEWVIGDHGRQKGEVIRAREEPIFHSVDEIEHAIFLERLETIEATYGDSPNQSN